MQRRCEETEPREPVRAFAFSLLAVGFTDGVAYLQLQHLLLTQARAEDVARFAEDAKEKSHLLVNCLWRSSFLEAIQRDRPAIYLRRKGMIVPMLIAKNQRAGAGVPIGRRRRSSLAAILGSSICLFLNVHSNP